MAAEGNQELRRMLDDARAIDDPEERAKAGQRLIRELQEAVAQAAEIRRSGVREMRARGDSHRTVADVLGVSRSAAQQIAEGRETRD